MEEELSGFTDLLDYPLYVVTASADGEQSGCLVGFASQCSLDPPRFMVWLSTANHTYKVALRASFLGVHVLRREQRELAELFGGRTGDRIDKFAHVRWHAGHGGAPVLPDSPGWFIGRVESRTPGGDHVGFLLVPVEEGGTSRGRDSVPLLRLSDVEGLTAGHPA